MGPSPWSPTAWFLLISLPAAVGAQQVDTVRVGSTSLQPSLLIPGTYVHDNYRVDGGNRTFVSRTTQTVEGGRETIVIRTAHASSSDTSRSVTVVRRTDLALVHHEVRAPRDSTDVTVSGEYLTAWVVLPNTPTRLIGLRLTRGAFPIEGQIPWLMGLLPLTEGYRAAVPHFSEWAGREVWRDLEVEASEHIRIGDTTVDCWKVDAGPLGPPAYRATRWIDKATRRVVQSALLGAPGQTEYWSWAVTR